MREFNVDRVYFPNLNGLRFIAALMVIIHHIEQFKSIYGLPNNFSSSTIQIFGELGVVLFFVLSGFLITYLLLEEESQTRTIQIRNFYVRRILRIWPLYFLIVVLSLLVLPTIPLFVLPGYDRAEIYNDLAGKIFLYLFFLPNLVAPLFGIVPYASLTWSIGTEEQFYLTWPVLLKNVKKYRLLLMLLIVFGYLLVARALYSSRTDFLPFKYEIGAFWATFNIDCMAIGGFFALLLHAKNSFLKVFQNKYLFYFALVFTSFLLYRGVYFPILMVNDIKFEYLYKEFYALWFGVIILNFAANREILISLESGILRYLGKISYGLYMFHPICIVLVLNIALLLKQTSNLLLYPLSLLTTILIAGLSYKYFESNFLKFKRKFTIVTSGENVENTEQSARPEQFAKSS
jgi:peptidoglycan/LPS O-acetylase OafA/YrhL